MYRVRQPSHSIFQLSFLALFMLNHDIQKAMLFISNNKIWYSKAHVRPIVIAAASTGNANINKNEVTKMAHTYKGRLFINIDSCL